MFKQKTLVLVAVVLMGIVAGGVAAMAGEYRFVGSVDGYLSRPGNYDIYEETLRGGQHYKITLSGPWSADFDILVFDENENLVAKSVGTSSSETVTITPRWTGPFFIVVMSYEGRGSYTVRLYRYV